MKLEPITTARRAVLGGGDDGAAVAEGAEVVHVRQIATGQVELDRVGAGREQQLVVM